jgi:hypothetical protein
MSKPVPQFEQSALDHLGKARLAIEHAMSNYQAHFVDAREACNFVTDALDSISAFLAIVITNLTKPNP